jgi:hypothetical protein
MKNVKLIIVSLVVICLIVFIGLMGVNLSLNLGENQIDNLKSKEGCFIDKEDGTVIDNCTNLMWKKIHESEPVDWETAKLICESDNTAEYNDWRLPTKEELELFVDKDCKLSNLPNDNCVGIWINNVFEAPYWKSKINYYWSSTVVDSPIDRMTYILIASEFGITGAHSELRSKNESIGVRCVRSK